MEKSKLVVTEEDELENQGEQLLKAIFGTFALSRILYKENNQPLRGKKWLGPGLKKSSLYLQRNFSLNTGIDQYQKHFLEFSDHQVFDARIEKWLHRWIFLTIITLTIEISTKFKPFIPVNIGFFLEMNQHYWHFFWYFRTIRILTQASK